MPRRASPTAFFRMALIAMLALGLCLQPVLAAACEIEDVQTALDQGAGAASVGSDADAAGGASDCCVNAACGDCCLHATASAPGERVAGVPAMPGIAVMAPTSEVRASDYPVDIRPPIAR